MKNSFARQNRTANTTLGGLAAQGLLIWGQDQVFTSCRVADRLPEVIRFQKWPARVSLVYQEGLFRTVAHTRFSAAAVGGHGPDLVIGKATTRGFHQSVLSKQLNPRSEVVVPKADSLVRADVSLDRLDRLLRKQHY